MNIIFETTDGHEVARATFTKHPLLRPPQLAFQGQWHLQNRQDGETWVYRAVDGTPGTCGTDPGVRVIE